MNSFDPNRRVVLTAAMAAAFSAAALIAPEANANVAMPPIGKRFRILCYHDIRDDLRGSFRLSPEATALSTGDLTAHFEWLRVNGYRPVSLDQIFEARSGKTPLPAKAVLLTFDDGYKSFYERVYPLLKTFRYPALIAVVEEWLGTPADGKVFYDNRFVDRTQFLNWDELREMTASGLVEVASHSGYLHKGVVANPQGSSMPAAVTLKYLPETNDYESFDAYRQRIAADFDHAARNIEAHLGKRPRAVVWPYGAYNRFAIEAAQRAGHTVGFSLQSIYNSADGSPMEWGRELVVFNTDTGGLQSMLEDRPSNVMPDPELRMRVMHVDLDYLYDTDPAAQDRNLGTLIERVRAFGVSHVFLQAFADPDGDGVADAMYFPNRHLPMRADLFARAAWQLRTRAGVRVFAWMPTLAFALPANHAQHKTRVKAHAHAKRSAAQQGYARLTPFSPQVRQVLREIYEDLGRHAGGIQGVLFHDDATLDDFEDTSPDAVRALAAAGLPSDIAKLRDDPQAGRRWAKFKTRALTDLTLELAAVLRDYVPGLLTARNLYAEVALNRDSTEWFAQDLDDMLASYDFTAIMAMPYMEEARDAQAWLAKLADTVLAHKGASERALFELQSTDWRTQKPVPSAELARHVTTLRQRGARHLGYYPDDFVRGHPDVKTLRPAFSLTSFPVKK